MRLASFDIFDTVLVRKSFSPQSIFRLTAERLFENNKKSIESWYNWRLEVESYIWAKNVHYSIADVYQELSPNAFPEYTPNKMMEIEMQVESEELVCNLHVKNIIDSYRNNGFQIAFISDMYLPSFFLKAVLMKRSCWKDGDLIYVSCEERARKSTGELFEKIKTKLSPKEWIHYGDNEYSDVQIPKKYGVKSVKVNTSKVGLECLIDSKTSAILRTIRLQMGNSPLSILSAHYVAPLYVPYVKWLLDDAHKRDIKKLYFLSRDAYILMKIAEQIPHDGTELRYLFVSRKSLKSEVYAAERDFYLQQEGLFEVTSAAIVDVGWIGTTRMMLNQILKNHGCSQIFSYYLLVNEDCIPKEYGNFSSFIEKPIVNEDITSFIEDFCSLCPYPTTIGYTHSESRWDPIFPDNEHYKESLLINSNIDACIKYLLLVNEFHLSNAVTRQTLEISLTHLFSYTSSIDFSPLDGLSGCDGKPAYKKLSKSEVLKILLGELVTLNDRASLEMTVGLKVMKIFWKIHNKIYRIKKNRRVVIFLFTLLSLAKYVTTNFVNCFY